MAEPASSAASIKGNVQVHELNRTERAVVRRSAESRATVPDLQLEAVAQLRSAPVGTDREALVVRACALALRNHPRANASYRDGHIETYSRINLGIVVAVGSTYVLPTIFDADRLSRAQLSERLADLRRRAESAQLSAPELGGATFTLWDLEGLGMSRATIPVVPPQACALTAGATQEVAQVHDGALRPGWTVTLELSCDHRALYGGLAANFLLSVKHELEQQTE